MMKLIVDENLLSFKVLEQKVCDKCSLSVPLDSSNSGENFVTRGYKHVGMRLAYFACPYPYAFVKREWRKRFGEPLTARTGVERRTTRRKSFFYGITEKKKSANEHLTQTWRKKNSFHLYSLMVK